MRAQKLDPTATLANNVGLLCDEIDDLRDELMVLGGREREALADRQMYLEDRDRLRGRIIQLEEALTEARGYLVPDATISGGAAEDLAAEIDALLSRPVK